jgi:predicted deacetylase
MCPNERPALCVAIHDVAPATWAECQLLLRAVREVADIPLTWLVVPQYHGSALRSLPCERMLESLLAQGHELALHGLTHRDAAPPGGTLLRRWLRTVYTEREGEFAAICRDEARRRIDQGLAWFAQRGWPVEGFVAPAWLLSRPAWEAVADSPFTYTTTYAHFHLLRPARRMPAPALVYAARNRAGRLLSPPLAATFARASSGAPLVRVALHPRDACHPALLRHAQRLIARLLASRAAVTKAAFARALAERLTSTGPSDCPCPSGRGHRPPSTKDSPSAQLPLWRLAEECSRAIDPS